MCFPLFPDHWSYCGCVLPAERHRLLPLSHTRRLTSQRQRRGSQSVRVSKLNNRRVSGDALLQRDHSDDGRTLHMNTHARFCAQLERNSLNIHRNEKCFEESL
jgi:hypothetical protein